MIDRRRVRRRSFGSGWARGRRLGGSLPAVTGEQHDLRSRIGPHRHLAAFHTHGLQSRGRGHGLEHRAPHLHLAPGGDDAEALAGTRGRDLDDQAPVVKAHALVRRPRLHHVPRPGRGAQPRRCPERRRMLGRSLGAPALAAGSAPAAAPATVRRRPPPLPRQRAPSDAGGAVPAGAWAGRRHPQVAPAAPRAPGAAAPARAR